MGALMAQDWEGSLEQFRYRRVTLKYCAGIVLTSPEVRANRLHAELRALRAVVTWAN